MHTMSTNFAKTLVWKHGNDVKLWRHKQRTPKTNNHHMTLNQTTPMKIFYVRHCTPEPWGKLTHIVTTYPKTTFASKFHIQVNSFRLLTKKLIHLLLMFVPINSSKNIPLMFINVGAISKYLPCAIRLRRKVKFRPGCFLGSSARNNMAIFQSQSEVKYLDAMMSASSYLHRLCWI